MPASAPQQQTLAPARAGGRMSLANVRTGKIRAPLRELLFGPPGIGKSTWAADAPAPIFLGQEEGTNQLDVARFSQPATWADVKEAIRELGSAEHPHKTLVLDTVDWLEPLLHAQICEQGDAKGPVNHISEYGGGYNKGTDVALDGWRELLSWLERLQAKRGMNVILLAHAQIKSFKNPMGEDFDRYTLKLDPKAAALLREWSESVLFANFDMVAKKANARARAKGVSIGARFIHTAPHVAYDAKTRYGLPERLPLSFADFAQAVERAQPADPAELTKSIDKGIAELTDVGLAGKAQDALKRAGANSQLLVRLNNWINAKLAQQAEDGPAEPAAETPAPPATPDPAPEISSPPPLPQRQPGQEG